MKTTLFVIAMCLLFSAVSLGQTASAISSQVQMVVIPDHPEHASQHEMAREQSLLSEPSITYAQGERPLWEFGPVSAPPTPLGDVARAFRQQHTLAKKAEIIFEK